jgi:branched-chain amino acid transport system substrate-binding protein
VVLGVLTGEAAPDVVQATQLAAADLNARAAGRYRFAVRALMVGDSSVAVAAAQLRDDPAVVGVVGPLSSSDALAAVPVLADVEHAGARALLAVSPSAASPRLTGVSPWFLRLGPTGRDRARAVVRFLRDSLRAARPAVFFENYAYGRDWEESFRAQYAAEGGRVVVSEPYLDAVVEWPAYAAYAARAGADAVVLVGTTEGAPDAVRELRAAGLRVPVVGGDLLEALARDPAAATAFRHVHYTTSFRAAAARTREARAFVARFRQAHRADPDYAAAFAYDAALALGDAVLAAGTDRRRVRDWVAALGTGRPARAGAGGPVGFDRHGDALGKTPTVAAVAP